MLIRRLFSEAVLEARLTHGPDQQERAQLSVCDADALIELDRIESIFFELVAATPDERLALLEAGYYLHLPRRSRRWMLTQLECA